MHGDTHLVVRMTLVSPQLFIDLALYLKLTALLIPTNDNHSHASEDGDLHFKHSIANLAFEQSIYQSADICKSDGLTVIMEDESIILENSKCPILMSSSLLNLDRIHLRLDSNVHLFTALQGISLNIVR